MWKNKDYIRTFIAAQEARTLAQLEGGRAKSCSSSFERRKKKDSGGEKPYSVLR